MKLFGKISLDQKPTRIYYGLDHACRCGCKGTYADVETKTFNRRMQRIAKLEMTDIVEMDIGGNNVNISLPENKAFTIYFD